MRTPAMVVLVMLLLVPSLALAQAAGPTRPPDTPGSAGPKDDGSIAQRGGQPSAGEVRPGNANGNSPSASAGELERNRLIEGRIFGLPVTAALVIGGAIVALLVIAGIVIPGARRRARAPGRGTHGPRT